MAPSILATSIASITVVQLATKELAIVAAAFALSFELIACSSSCCYFSRLITKATKTMLAFVKPSEVDPSDFKPSEVRPSRVRPSEVRSFEVEPFRVASPSATISFASIAIFIAASTFTMAPFIVTDSSSTGSLDQSTKAVKMV